MSFIMKESAGQKTASRVTKPPGGDCSDIFCTGPVQTPPSTPSKKNHMRSNIFAPAESTGTPQGRKNGADSTSFTKLFGEMAVTNGGEVKGTFATPVSTPRVVKDHQKSNILAQPEKNGVNGTSPDMNGHAGPKKVSSDVHDSASSSGNSSGSVTPNGSVNGDSEPRMNGSNGTAAPAEVTGTPKKRIPPGGHATKLW